MGVSRKKKTGSPDQGDLFAAEHLFPVRERKTELRALDLSLKIKTGLGRALKECPDSATIVAARMSEITGREITPDALYAYTAPSKPEHDMSLLRFIAFVRATGAVWLWDLLVEDEGLIVFEQEAAHVARLGLLHHQRAQLTERIQQEQVDLQLKPFRLSRPRGDGR